MRLQRVLGVEIDGWLQQLALASVVVCGPLGYMGFIQLATCMPAVLRALDAFRLMGHCMHSHITPAFSVNARPTSTHTLQTT